MVDFLCLESFFFLLKSYPYLGTRNDKNGGPEVYKNDVFFFKSLLLPMKTFRLLMPIASNRSFLSLFVLKILTNAKRSTIRTK